MKKFSLNRKNIKWLVLIFIIIFAFSIPGFLWMKRTNHDRAQRRKSLLSPIVMVPGSSATVDRFNSLISSLNKNNPRPHSVLKVQVKRNGSLAYSGSINHGDNEPIIVIGFQNNHDGYDNIKKQASWLDEAFYEVSETYKFNNFKAFGHSNGGLILTYWLEHYYSYYSSDIKLKRLMTLASPYNFNEAKLSHRTQMLEDFIKYRQRIPKKLYVYSLTGGKTYQSDGIVPEASVAAAKYIFQNRVKRFMEITITGDQAYHSDLPQNRQVVQVMKQYLLAKRPPVTHPLIKHNKKREKQTQMNR